MVTTHCPSPAKVVRHTSTAGTTATDKSQWRFSSNFVDPSKVNLLRDRSNDKGTTAVSHDDDGLGDRCRSNDNSSEDEACVDEPSLDRDLNTSLSLADHLVTPQNEQGVH